MLLTNNFYCKEKYEYQKLLTGKQWMINSSIVQCIAEMKKISK